VDGVVLRFLVGCRKYLDDGVEQIARAVTVECRDRPRLAESEVPELMDGVLAPGRVELVDDQEDRSLLAPEKGGHLLVALGDARHPVDEEDDHVGLARCDDRLVADGFTEGVVGGELDAARVDEHELAPFQSVRW
jgi:hypothetical protein